MWKQEKYEGFEIHVQAVPKFGPPPAEGVPFGYTGYVTRPGNVVAVEANVRRFTRHEATFESREEAESAAFEEGRSVVDGNHKSLNVKGL
ncbi:conserved protein of unknown function [Pararobbsia alpina]